MQRPGMVLSVGVGAALVVSSCTAILGIDEDYIDVGYGGGALVAATVVTTGGVCPVVHPGAGKCEYLPGQECGCIVGEKCSVTNESTGESQCIPARDLQQGQPCSVDLDCAAGFWCDHFTNTCKKICTPDSNCGGGLCLSALSAALSAIPGLQICTTSCDPFTGQPCGSNLTCTFNTATLSAFDCFVSPGNIEGQACVTLQDCGKGLVCQPGVGTCTQWCKTGKDCPAEKTQCILFDPPIQVSGITYGYCTP